MYIPAKDITPGLVLDINIGFPYGRDYNAPLEVQRKSAGFEVFGNLVIRLDCTYGDENFKLQYHPEDKVKLYEHSDRD